MRLAHRHAAIALAVLGALVAVFATVALHARRSDSSPVAEVAPGVFHVRNFLSDVYGARAGADVLLFDAGVDPEGRAVDDLLRALGATREQVTHVFLSHGHFDHIAAAVLFPRARVHLGKEDVAMAVRRVSASPLSSLLLGVLTGGTLVDANSPLEGRQSIPVGGGDTVLALPFPGHTPGSYVYLFRGVLFAGDSLSIDAGQLAPAEPTHSVDPLSNHTSIGRLPRLLGYERVDYVCTGHDSCTSTGNTRALLQQLLSELAPDARP